jgi:hypothetical protein
LSFSAFLSAQEGPANNDEEPDTTVYVIRAITFDVTGRSRPFALSYYGKLTEGEEITGKAAMDFYIQDHTQLLLNQRVLKDDVQIIPSFDAPDGDGKIPVDLLVIVADTWNIMVFPKPIWDSNSGFEITLKARDYNFFGTMNAVKVDFGYQLNNRKESSFNLLLDLDIPFTALGYNWNINFDNEFIYSGTAESEYTLGYFNTTGISMELPWRRTTFVFDITHHINWKQKNDYWAEADYGKYFDGLYNSVSFGTDWRIPTGLEVFNFGELIYTPGVSEVFTYNPGGWDMLQWDGIQKSVTTHINQSLSFGRIDWKGNFRKGLEVILKNQNSFNHVRNVWNNYYTLDATAHFLFTDFFGIASRLQFRHWFTRFPFPLHLDAGDVLRGVRDNSITADRMLSFNLEFPFRVLAAKPSEWFHAPKLNIFNFELFVAPVFDMGLVHTSIPRNNQKGVEFYTTGGLEVLIFPDIMRSLYIRFSYGINLGNTIKYGRIPPSDENEFFIGLYHFF